jgi:serine/threonine protein kinase
MNRETDSGTALGQKTSWSLLKKLAEGDAGEVYLVESLLDHEPAILKRPQPSVFSGDVRRQADQIQTESRILKALELLLGSPPEGRLRAPALLDQSKPGSEGSDRFFIVIERALGFDLSFLARLSQLGMAEKNEIEATPVETAFFQEIARSGKLPERILIEALSAVFSTFAAIHEIPGQTPGVTATSIMWNDVKPDHLFWDPKTASITIIDWGNGQYVDPGTSERSLRHTPLEDRRQFLDEMNRFLAQVAPTLAARLEWPAEIPPAEDFKRVFDQLCDKVSTVRLEANQALAAIRQEEAELVQPGPQAGESVARLEELHKTIISLGELPDYQGAYHMAANSIGTLASTGELEQIQHLCSWAASLPTSEGNPQFWLLLARLAKTVLQVPESMRPRMAEAVRAAAADDWDGALWYMLAALGTNAEPDWWYELTQQARVQAAGDEMKAIPPLLSLRRLVLHLQTNSLQLEDRLVRSPSSEGDQRLASMQALLEMLRRAVQNWVQLDPLPPYSAINYGEIEQLFPEIERCLPGGGAELQRLLEKPRSQVHSLLEDWGRKEFVNVGQGLRRLLVLDPDRRRLVRADQAVQAAPDWLLRLQHGTQPGEHLPDFVTELEYEGREMRSQLGPAGWLDGILDGLKALRLGGWPGDLLVSQPALLNEMPWLRKFVRSEVLAQLLRPNQAPLALPSILGERETRFGPESEITLVEPLDAWMPEARGSSARVYLCNYLSGGGEQRQAALKLLRLDKADYALPLFREEVRVLSAMQDVPGVARLLECGFLRVALDEGRLPPDHDLEAIAALCGDALRIGPDCFDRFSGQIESRIEEGWAPYLLIEKRRREDNLLLMCDASLNHGHFQPVPDLLFIAIQICDILHAAHQRNVVYRDHKILHYYWQPENNGVSIIDWNVARYHPEGLSAVDIDMDLVQLGARGLHHVLTGRTAPGALPMGPTRPEEIEQAALSYAAQWTYDDQRLSNEVRAILEQLLSGSYTSAADLRDDLKRAYMDSMSGSA